MKHIPYIITLLFIFCSSYSFAQDNNIKEVGLNYGTYGYGPIYKFGGQKSVWRTRFNIHEISKEKFQTANNERERSNLNLGIYLGKEWRSYKGKRFTFKYGGDLGFEYWRTKDKGTQINPPVSTVRYGYARQIFVNAVIGFNYNIAKRIVLGFEALPRFGISYNNSKVESSSLNEKSDIAAYFERGYELNLSVSYRLN